MNRAPRKCLHGQWASECERCDTELPRPVPGASSFPKRGSPWEQAVRQGREPTGDLILYRALEGFARGVYYVNNILPGVPNIDNARMIVAQGETRPGMRKGVTSQGASRG